MYNLLISAGAAVSVLLILMFGFTLVWWGSLMIALLVFMGVFLLFSRITMKKVTVAMETAGKDLQGQRFEKAVRELKDALKYGKWQIYVEGQINAQIGMIYYMKRDFSNAFPYLEKAFFKNWAAMGMLGICYMKRQKKDKMMATFEKALQWTSKESLFWNLYAYCLVECGETTKAKEVLEKGLKKLPGDTNIKDNLENLLQGKKMKMRHFGDMWYQFHLESVAAIQKHQMAAMGGRMQRRMTVRK
ncbi:MAG: tetratricopeptide repeat protein [Desulfobacteraceae bacterium]|nr:tetratricopeptide repeat protein [Desulfobacteraceae bacterium]